MSQTTIDKRRSPAREKREMQYHCADGYSGVIESTHADTPQEAAESYVAGGDWGDGDKTSWVTVRTWTGMRESWMCESLECDYEYVRETAEAEASDDAPHVCPLCGSDLMLDESERIGEESVKVAIEATEPDCVGEDHLWSDAHDLVGGIKENPGVWGHGGGVKITTVCVRCGCERTYDTWAQDPEDGEQGLESTEYEPDARDPGDIVLALIRDRDIALADEHMATILEMLREGTLWPDGCGDDPWEMTERVRAEVERLAAEGIG